ncbi:glycosyl transferase [Amycolatopsis mediterranei S699]|uniref:Glucosyl-3-phosphoglycerate synthase n=2 Tax=Amycolatopsis mediterranei TaxID=33910 RepID=A0A0H3D2X8_AMYMU|nr:glucosyl-3-phosphoglycerate synthase [Amycolatopsis mediterranei]ADJ44577.1 glycosyl transferase family protein [Amycolatopsis mediterranei U32]AEK41316.1 putative glucosyl-3-phosphoglycerate synthase [Amycolatopsis mediterranei S699]AFO76290.1 glycosyl transferase [Amycolatopsis mediterranei S699]AGT83419.1 glycosyl transferase [Amycolatopsis mediterranei RB]KDO07065.1 glucosyl-3-phosphoglycerate synthase [Amycolatopsis mediterranei]
MRNTHLQVTPAVGTWLARRSSKAEDWTTEELVAAKRGTTVSVVIPARNEEATVGAIVAAIREELQEHHALVDEILVVDSHSTDATAEVAAAAGADVVAQDAVFPALEGLAGKGEALWKGVAATTGDLVVFVDGDLHDFTTSYVTGLLGPLLTDPSVAYVKGFYHRPLGDQADGGGRVTELVARPLLNMFWPELSGFVQPLAGEYAGRREVLESIPFVVNYGVEIGHLIDLTELRGLDALAQVDLGHRVHRHQSTQALGRMAGQIMLTLFDRLERYDRLVTAVPPATLLAQFQRGTSADGVERELVLTDLTSPQRPPLDSLPASIRPENALQETA